MSKHIACMGLRDTVESTIVAKINNSGQNSFHHKTCLLCAFVGFLLDCCANLPPTEAACAHFVNHNTGPAPAILDWYGRHCVRLIFKCEHLKV